jgi:nucleotide-binding universal stress UspA family protein
MHRVTSILCPVDLSPHSVRTLRHAVAVARHEGARLTLLHVVEPLLVQAASMTYDANYLEDEARRELNALVVAAEIDKGSSKPSCLVRIGLPHAQTLEVAREVQADLLVLGTQGQTGASRVFFGSTVARVLRETSVPVLAIGPGSRGLVEDDADGPALHVDRIVVGVDFSEMTPHTVHTAALLAGRWGCRLQLLHAVDEAHGMERWRRLVDAHQHNRVARAKKELTMLADEVRNGTKPVQVETAIGTPELVIAAAGAERDRTLLVLGLRSQQGIVGQQPGSIAYRVLCLSEAPVLVVPPVAAKRGQRRR